MFPFTNYFNFSLDDVHDMLEHPASVWGLGDGGAHCGAAVDSSGPTLMLTHWVHDRVRGPRIDLPTAVRWMTSDTADLYGLHDRGRIAPGYRADLNVIDHEQAPVGQPEMVFDLPAGGRRLMQRARGYVATVVAGEITIRDDEATGALPGRLIRGEQPTPRRPCEFELPTGTVTFLFTDLEGSTAAVGATPRRCETRWRVTTSSCATRSSRTTARW